MLQLRRCPRCEARLEENHDIYSTHKNCFQCGYLYVGNGYFDEIQKPVMQAINPDSEIAKRIKSVVKALQIEKFVKRAQRIQIREEAASGVSPSYSRKPETHVHTAVMYADLTQSPPAHPRIPTWIGAETLMGSARELIAMSEVIRIRSEMEANICTSVAAQ